MPNQDDNWPRPTFYFKVMIPSLTNPVLFQQLSGLETEPQGTEYRHGSKPETGIKVPEGSKAGRATLHKGIFANDNKFSEWYSKIGMRTTGKENVVIQLLDEKGNPTMWWTLVNAWPIKITAMDMKSEGNEVAVESLEFAYETLVVNNG